MLRKQKKYIFRSSKPRPKIKRLLPPFAADVSVVVSHAQGIIQFCQCHESWVVPAGVSSALAVLGGEIPSRIDSSTIWGGGCQTVEESIFLLARGEGGGFGVSIPPWSGQLCVRKG